VWICFEVGVPVRCEFAVFLRDECVGPCPCADRYKNEMILFHNNTELAAGVSRRPLYLCPWGLTIGFTP
jgi:hypothetical protein